jgi:hypothetical protein
MTNAKGLSTRRTRYAFLHLNVHPSPETIRGIGKMPQRLDSIVQAVGSLGTCHVMQYLTRGCLLTKPIAFLQVVSVHLMSLAI